VSALTLRAPSADQLPAYIAALREGWSPNTTRDVSAEQLAAIAADATAFLAQFQRDATGTISLGDGREVPRLPGATFWISDGSFCGVINYRHVPGSEELPPHVSGHVGYAIVPWRRREGLATAALRLLLPVLRERGLPRVLITCDEDNIASRRVIEANGGVFDGVQTEPGEPAITKLRFWVRTAPAAGFADTPPAA